MSEKRSLDWKDLGRFFSVALNLFTIIRETWSQLAVGLEIMAWLTGDGRQTFIEEFLQPLARKFLATRSDIIDCDSDPYVPSGWSICKEDQIVAAVRGQMEWIPAKVELFQPKKWFGHLIRGHQLRKKLAGKFVLNANVLDYLLVHPELIPDEWKSKVIYFWGTIYRSQDRSLCVRCLCWEGDSWVWRCNWLGNMFHRSSFVALAA